MPSRRFSDDETTRTLSAFVGRIDAERKRIADEYAAKWDAAKRQQAVKNGDALPDGSFPIVDQEDLDNAARLSGNSSHPRSTVAAHIKRQAKKHGLTLPQSLRGN